MCFRLICDGKKNSDDPGENRRVSPIVKELGCLSCSLPVETQTDQHQSVELCAQSINSSKLITKKPLNENF